VAAVLLGWLLASAGPVLPPITIIWSLPSHWSQWTTTKTT